MRDPSAYARYVAALPRQYDTDLMTSTSVSTAFYQALENGWEEVALIGDAVYALRRGGVGLLLTRLRGFSEIAPPERSVAPRRTNQFIDHPAEPLLPSDWRVERNAILRLGWSEKRDVSEEMGEAIARQRGGGLRVVPDRDGGDPWLGD